MDNHPYITPETAAATIVPQLSSDSRLVVTGQIGCGKTTLSKAICARLGLTHLHIDAFNGDADPMASAIAAANAIDGGWVAEANIWQIPKAIWASSDLAIFLDYANAVHYRQIVGRCLRSCMSNPTWTNIQASVNSELEHLAIVFRYADENRADWQASGGITKTATPVIRCSSPRGTKMLLANIDQRSG